MHKQNLKFVIVGHVDHGKSTLIGRLFFDTDSVPPDKVEEVRKSSEELGRDIEFAFLVDHLEEERTQGITIDTAQAFFKTDKREYVIIDAPGHVEFMKNMITGASQADAAVLIIDANSGMQEQTRRHAYILSMLGIRQVVVVVNKMDLTGYDEERFNGVKRDMKSFLDSINIKPGFYIPISAVKGDNIANRSVNMAWYNGPTVLESLDSLIDKVPMENMALLFPVQDMYKMNGEKVIVGRIEAGSIRRGQEIKVLPDGQLTKVKSIEKFLEDVNESHAGESTGITIQDHVSLDRGSVICEPGKEPSLTDTFRANIFWFGKEDFDMVDRITLRCATQEVNCKVEEIKKRIDSSTLELIEEDAPRLRHLEAGEVIIKTKRPVVIKAFNEAQELGRFVFVRNENICAGGIVTEVNI